MIRAAAPPDVEAIAAVYAHHVRHGTGTYDYEAPDTAFWHDKLALLNARGWPFLVSIEDDRLLGYAYAAQMRDRQGYRGTCEDSIYVAPDAQGQGVGTALLEALIERAAVFPFRQMIAVIGGAEPASIALHARCGFTEVGRLREVGEKFGRLLDNVYMQRRLRASARS